MSGQTLLTVVLFMTIYSLAKPYQGNALTAHYYEMSSALPLGPHYRIEAVVIRETAINLGRSLGVLLFLLFSARTDTGWISWLLVLVMGTQLKTWTAAKGVLLCL